MCFKCVGRNAKRRGHVFVGITTCQVLQNITFPSISGIFSSSNTTSTAWIAHTSTASAPEPTEATTLRSECLPSTPSIPSRTKAWSSTRTMRMIPSLGVPAGVMVMARPSLYLRPSVVLNYGCAFAGVAGHCQGSAHLRSTFLHAGQPIVPLRNTNIGLKTYAVILYTNNKFRVTLARSERQAFGVAVFNGICHRLTNDANKVLLFCERQLIRRRCLRAHLE